MARRRVGVHPRIELDPSIRTATVRVVRGVMQAVRDGSLRDGDPMPSTRALADTCGVARSSVVVAYETLCGMGVLFATQGRGTAVRDGARRLLATEEDQGRRATPRASVVRGTDRKVLDLSVPGCTALEALDPQDWSRSWRRAVDPRRTADGAEALSAALAGFLRVSRGICVESDDLVLRPSLGAAVTDILDAYDLAGRGVAIEDPGIPGLQRRLTMAGCRVQCVPVDDEGLRVDLIGPDVAAVHVTPARQWPTGAPMSPRRRGALLEWSRRTGGVVIENDLDADFVYDCAPPAPLVADARPDDRVVYLGSSAKLVADGLLVVWLAPPWGFRRRGQSVAPVSDYVAWALADYLTSGALYRHHSRALRLLRDRRNAMVANVTERVPRVRVRGETSGTEAVIELPRTCDAVGVRSKVHAAGFRCSTLGDFAVRGQPPALVLDYGRLPTVASSDFACALAAAVET